MAWATGGVSYAADEASPAANPSPANSLVPAASQRSPHCWRKLRLLQGGALDRFRLHRDTVRREIAPSLQRTVYPEVPTVYNMHLPQAEPQKIRSSKAGPSRAMTDSLLEEARELKAFDDFKILSDLNRKRLGREQLREVLRIARNAADLAYQENAHLEPQERVVEARRAYLRSYIEGAYEMGEYLRPAPDVVRPEWRVETGKPHWDRAFDYTEEILPQLVYRTVETRRGSGLPAPYPVIIAAPGRFHETYYWDTYFGIRALLRTGRTELAMMQVENFLYAIQKHGLVPNGWRDYYLDRSQPPFLSSMAREVTEQVLSQDPGSRAKTLRWLRERALPLLERDYARFWMQEGSRYDTESGLNKHWAANVRRPERHGSDKEEELGVTDRDVRAAAESGLDFTGIHGRRASDMAGPMLNSIMYKMEMDLAHMHETLGDGSKAAEYRTAAAKRKEDMIARQWNPEKKRFEYYDTRTKTRVPHLTAETFAPLYAGMFDMNNARDRAIVQGIVSQLKHLEKPGGIATSDLVDSSHQWDGNNGWAPFQVLAVRGLRNYGYDAEARRVATKWVDTIARIHEKRDAMFERIDVAARDIPVEDGTKYHTQRGFWWTNMAYQEMLIDVLGARLVPRETPSAGGEPGAPPPQPGP